MPGPRSVTSPGSSWQIVGLPAEVDVTNACMIGGQLAAALTPGVAIVIADMSATVFCDCRGARTLALICQRAAVNGAEFRLAARSAAVLRVLALLELDQIIPAYPTVAAALAC